VKWTDERFGNGAAPRHYLHSPAAGSQSAAGGAGSSSHSPSPVMIPAMPQGDRSTGARAFMPQGKRRPSYSPYSPENMHDRGGDGREGGGMYVG
jgi:hypothetical protein